MSASNIARWDGTAWSDVGGGSWTPLDVGVPGPVFAMGTCSVGVGTTLYAVGQMWGVSDWDAP